MHNSCNIFASFLYHLLTLCLSLDTLEIEKRFVVSIKERSDTMKKRLPIFLTALMLFCCVGCSESAPTEQYSKPNWWVEPTPSPDVSQALTIGKPFTISGTASPGEWDESGPPDRDKLELTVLGYEVYDDYRDSGIPKEEFAWGIEDDIRQQPPLVLVDITIKKVSGVKKEVDRYSRENINIFRLCGKKQLQWCEDNDWEALTAELHYFSGQGERGEDGKGYSYYWLDVGEEQTYQLGFFLFNPNRLGKEDYIEGHLTSVEGGLMLGIDSGGSGRTNMYVDLDT